MPRHHSGSHQATTLRPFYKGIFRLGPSRRLKASPSFPEGFRKGCSACCHQFRVRQRENTRGVRARGVMFESDSALTSDVNFGVAPICSGLPSMTATGDKKP